MALKDLLLRPCFVRAYCVLRFGSAMLTYSTASIGKFLTSTREALTWTLHRRMHIIRTCGYSLVLRFIFMDSDFVSFNNHISLWIRIGIGFSEIKTKKCVKRRRIRYGCIFVALNQQQKYICNLALIIDRRHCWQTMMMVSRCRATRHECVHYHFCGV